MLALAVQSSVASPCAAVVYAAVRLLGGFLLYRITEDVMDSAADQLSRGALTAHQYLLLSVHHAIRTCIPPAPDCWQID